MQAPLAGFASQRAPKAEDFPALGGMRPASSSGATAEPSSSTQAAAGGQAGVSEALKAANKVRAALCTAVSGLKHVLRHVDVLLCTA